MKVISEHTIEASREELADALGYDGQVSMVTQDETAMQYIVKVVGVAKPPAPIPLVVTGPSGPTYAPPPPPPAEALAPRSDKRVVLIVEFTTTGDPVLLHAYASELQTELRRMLAAQPEEGVSATVSMR